MIARSVAICTNGTRVLGLGNIGPLASMPVMEGKSVFYHQFAGISAMPILIDASDVDGFVETVIRIAPTFGGIHLEDISAPECFEIEARLIEALPQPVMHDDVHGTAVVSVAAAIVACRHAGDRTGLGDGRTARTRRRRARDRSADGAERRARVIGFDPQPAAHARAPAAGIEIASMEEVMAQADVVVATTGRPGLITPEMIRPGQVILALTNPEPEIAPEEAERPGRRSPPTGGASTTCSAIRGSSRARCKPAPGYRPRDEARGRASDRRSHGPRISSFRTRSTRASTMRSRWRFATPRSAAARRVPSWRRRACELR